MMEDIREILNRTIGPLTIFGPGSSDVSTDGVHLERPVTPINNEIKCVPTVFSKLSDYVRRRLAPDSQLDHMTVDDQQELASVLMAEVAYIWPDLRTVAEDPFLNASQNKELQRRITVHVVTVCQILFRHSMQKFQLLNRRGVFTGPANMSRLKVQLTADANKFLNISTIRRHIADDIKHRRSKEQEMPTEDASVYSMSYAEEIPLDLEMKRHLSFTDLIDASRPKFPSTKKPCTVVEESIKQMVAEMPNLDMNKLWPAVELLLSDQTVFQTSERHEIEARPDLLKSEKEFSPEDQSLEKVRLKRSKSLIDMLHYEPFSEFEIRTQKKEKKLNLQSECTSHKKIQSKNAGDELQVNNRQFINDDLSRLIKYENEIHDPDEIPALLKAVMTNSKHICRKDELKKRLRELEEKEKIRKEKESLILQKHLHIQPATVTKQMTNKMVVQASDVRISNRISLSSLTINKHGTIYNHISNEIDAGTLKELDSNLFIKEEMTGVFEEIMKTMPRDHLQLETDLNIEDAAGYGSVFMTVPPTSLNRKRDPRIINKKLKPALKDSSSEQLVEQEVHSNNAAVVNRDLLSKSFASWLDWWKDMVNSDDYMKYLSTQETDYLGIIFHFYNSDDDEEDLERILIEKEKILQNEKKIKELMLQKSEYKPGLWNANSIFLGGLGKIPTVDSDEDSSLVASFRDEKHLQKKNKSSSFVLPKRLLDENVTSSGSSKMAAHSSAAEQSSAVLTQAQERLEKVWNLLQMPDPLKLDMAVKYSFEAYYSKLADAVNEWESITTLIIQRESILSKLEKFERYASNPLRFYDNQGSSVARLEEARTRQFYNKNISALDVRIKRILDKLERLFQDVVTYQGRPYRDKMESDRTEMLFWLHEQRKQTELEHEALLKNLPPLPVSLVNQNPISL